MRAFDRELAHVDHVHEFDASERATGRSKQFEVEHRPGDLCIHIR
jgi:hypothetical protein